jgi:hypothetical protein
MEKGTELVKVFLNKFARKGDCFVEEGSKAVLEEGGSELGNKRDQERRCHG